MTRGIGLPANLLRHVRPLQHARWLGLAASGLAHVALWHLLIPDRMQPAPYSAPAALEISIDVIPGPAPVVAPPPSIAPTATVSPPARRAPLTAPRPTLSTPEASAVAAPAAPTPSAAPPVQSKAPVMDLSPLAASRTVFDVRAAPQVRAEAPREAQATDPEQQLNQYLSEVARRRSWLSRSDDPVLVRQADGSLTHDGNGFDATIDPDGRVKFDDKYIDFDLVFKPQISADGSVSFVLFRARFSLDSWLDKQFGKGDPFRSERRWFMERTASLREERQQKHWTRVAKAGVVSLRHKLQDIWHDSKLSVWARKRETFRHWDECADDEVGQLGRAVVEAFILERCPPGSNCAYEEAELGVLNADRKSRTPFAPYARPPATHL